MLVQWVPQGRKMLKPLKYVKCPLEPLKTGKIMDKCRHRPKREHYSEDFSATLRALSPQ
jgi:hypothetical protein